MKSNSLKLRYYPKKGVVLLFYFLLLFTLYLLFCKSEKQYTLPFAPFNIGEFYSHISNFIITYNIVAVISFIWLLQGASLKMVKWLCVFFVLINIIVELFVTVLNTPDIVDALYGIAGILLAFSFALVLKTSGLNEIPQSVKEASTTN